MRQLTREDGFSMTELLVAMAIFAMVAGAVFTASDVFQRTYTRATGLEDAQLGVRAGLDRMATELRLAGSYWTGAGGAPITNWAITPATSTTSITFFGDVDADTVVAGTEVTLAADAASGATTITVSGNGTGFAANEYVHISRGAVREVRQIASNYAGGTAITLASALTNSFLANSVVRSVESVTYTFSGGQITRSVSGGTAEPIVENVSGLTLTYYQLNGTTTTTTPADIYEIQISLTTQGNDGSRRTMATRVRPRNLSLPQ